MSQSPYYRCTCKTGLQLGADGRSCRPAQARHILIFGQQKPGLVRGIDLESAPGHVTEVSAAADLLLISRLTCTSSTAKLMKLFGSEFRLGTCLFNFPFKLNFFVAIAFDLCRKQFFIILERINCH